MSSFRALTLSTVGASAAFLAVVGNVASAYAAPTALEAIIADYDSQCQAMHDAVLPVIDADLNAPPPKSTLKVYDEDIYQIEIDNMGKTGMVVYASFGCTNFGRPWCGIGGSCTSYLIVDDTVFEWQGGGHPKTVKDGDTVLITKAVSGSGCKDGKGANGFGAAPCYSVVVWDGKMGTFWSSSDDLQFRSDLSAP